jgi:hypothetical protein
MLHRPPRSTPAATQARWRARRAKGELVVPVTVRPCDRSKLVQAGYLASSRRDHRLSIAEGIARLLDLMET